MPLRNDTARPDISILMTFYNAAVFLSEAIESVLHQQTSRTWELLLVDDGSTDRSRQIAEEYAAARPGTLRVLQHVDGGNHGISASRNLALQHARGDTLAFLDADDIWLPHHLQTQAEVLDKLPRVAMVYAAAERWVDFDEPFDEARARAATWGRNYLPPLLPAGQRGGVLPHGKLLDWFLLDESLVPCICTVLIRTAAARAVDGFCDSFKGLYDDQAFHAKVAVRYDVYAHDVPVARYRQHAGSCCGQSRTDALTASRERERFLAFVQDHLRVAALAR